jgi:hypothetical protein
VKSERLRRMGRGDYMTADERFRVEYGWADAPSWVLVEYNTGGDANILEDCRTLRDARARIAAIRGRETSR